MYPECSSPATASDIPSHNTATVLRVVGDVNPLVAALAKTVDIQRVMKRGDLIVKVDGHDQELPLPVGVIPIELI